MSKISLKHSGGNVVSLNSPTNAPSAADVAFKLPNADGTNGQVLKTDGSGNLSFAADAGGKILQVVQGSTTAITTFNSSGTYVDSGLTKTITPTAASSKILVSYLIHLGADGGNWRRTRLEISVNSASYSAVTNALAMNYAGNTQSTSQLTTMSMELLDSPSYSLGQTVAYRVGVETGGSTFKLNAPSGQSAAYAISTITLMEVAA